MPERCRAAAAPRARAPHRAALRVCAGHRVGDRPCKRRHPATAEPPGDCVVGEGRIARRKAGAGPTHASLVRFREAPVPLTAKDVAEITRLLEQSDFLELRLEHEGFKLTLKRAGAPVSGTDSATAAHAAAASQAASALPAGALPVAGELPTA